MEGGAAVGRRFIHGKFRLGIMRNFFTMNIAKHWNRLSKEAVRSPALEILKTWQVKSRATCLKQALLRGGRLRPKGLPLPRVFGASLSPHGGMRHCPATCCAALCETRGRALPHHCISSHIVFFFNLSRITP